MNEVNQAMMPKANSIEGTNTKMISIRNMSNLGSFSLSVRRSISSRRIALEILKCVNSQLSFTKCLSENAAD